MYSSRKILITGYFLLACLYLFALINNGLNNLTGNRTLGAALALVYFSMMVFGLYNFSRLFTLVSILNFVVGIALVIYIMSLVLPQINLFLSGTLILSMLGLFLSVQAVREPKVITEHKSNTGIHSLSK